MRAEIKNLPKSEMEILFELSPEELEGYLEKAANILSWNLKIKGFRQGKVPRAIVEREIGQGRVLAEGAELAIKEEYAKFVLAKKIEVIGELKVDILKLASGNPFSFKVRVDVLPEIILPDYKEIASQVKQREVSVQDKEVEDVLGWLQKSRASFEDLDRKAQRGDFVQIEYQSPQIENNKVFKDGFVLGKGHFVQGFEEELEEMRTGEEKEFSLTFPENHLSLTNRRHSDGLLTDEQKLTGKEVTFRAKMKKVQLMKLADLNDDFAKSLGRFNDLNNLKEQLKEGIRKEKEMEEIQRWRGEVLEKIGSSVVIDVSETLIIPEQERMFKNLREEMEKELNPPSNDISNGVKMSFEDYLKKIRKTEDELKQELLKEAKKRVKNVLILKEIGKREKIEVEEQEIENSVNNFLKNYPGVEKAKKEIDLARLKDYYRDAIYNEKVFEKLLSFSKIPNYKSQITNKFQTQNPKF